MRPPAYLAHAYPSGKSGLRSLECVVKTAVALQVFNRPDLTERVVHEIVRALPPRVFVFADGPRTNEEAERCDQTREIVQRARWELSRRLRS